MDSSSGAIATRIDDITPGTTILNKVGLGGTWPLLGGTWPLLGGLCVCVCVWDLAAPWGGTWPLQGGGTWPLIGGGLGRSLGLVRGTALSWFS